MKSMITISKSLLLFTKVVMVMSTWRNTKCEQYDSNVYEMTSFRGQVLSLFKIIYAYIAQLVVQRSCKAQAPGSNPGVGTIIYRGIAQWQSGLLIRA